MKLIKKFWNKLSLAFKVTFILTILITTNGQFEETLTPNEEIKSRLLLFIFLFVFFVLIPQMIWNYVKQLFIKISQMSKMLRKTTTTSKISNQDTPLQDNNHSNINISPSVSDEDDIYEKSVLKEDSYVTQEIEKIRQKQQKQLALEAESKSSISFLHENVLGTNLDSTVQIESNTITSNTTNKIASVKPVFEKKKIYMDADEYLEKAAYFLIEKEKGSIGMLQRMFKIGFNRAERIMNQLEKIGVVEPEEGTKPRTILMTKEELENLWSSLEFIPETELDKKNNHDIEHYITKEAERVTSGVDYLDTYNQNRLLMYNNKFDYMEGHDFEKYCAMLLTNVAGYTSVEVTKGSNDFGIDIIAIKEGVKYGIQCKCYSSDIGVKAVQEASSGAQYYGCHVPVVLTNRYFTRQAKELASRTNVLLWDRDVLESLSSTITPIEDEITNTQTETVLFKEIIDSDTFRNHLSPLAFAMGKDNDGNIVISDIAKISHLLITSNSNFDDISICIDTLILSILHKSNPSKVKLILIDPTVVEFNVYIGISHLLIPVVTNPKKAVGALNWAVAEMTRRYQMFAETITRDLAGYNKKAKIIRAQLEKDGVTPDKIEQEGPEILPQIVIVVSELAELIKFSPEDVEDAICRLTQRARTTGIYLVLATQYPHIITRNIKDNIPSRIALSSSSSGDSRMLFYPLGYNNPIRVQRAVISNQEVSDMVNSIP